MGSYAIGIYYPCIYRVISSPTLNLAEHGLYGFGGNAAQPLGTLTILYLFLAICISSWQFVFLLGNANKSPDQEGVK
jgi:hypothetical protein